MKCLIFSDTHGNDRLIYKALMAHKDAEAFFFLGDGLSDVAPINFSAYNMTLFAVKGNCDFSSSKLIIPEPQKEDSVTLMGRKIIFTHGDLYDAKMGTMRLENLCERMQGDILLFGHTHQGYEKYVDVQEKYGEIVKFPEKIKELKNYYLFNPGSAGGYNGSYGILTLTENSILFSHGK